MLPVDVKREVFQKRVCETDSRYGCPPSARSVGLLLDLGVICLNKPKGPTSHLCAKYVQQILKVEKTGHGGSLDPGVTGVLPVALGRATRVMQSLLEAGKEYICIMRLHREVDEQKLLDVFESFRGRISQLPPVKSAVARRVREREIYYLDVLEIDGRDVLFRMGCQAGTYVRKVCHDMGQLLGVGAHMAELVRTRAGPFRDETWVSLQDLEDAFAFWEEENNDKFLKYCIQPVEFAVQHLPKVWIQDSAVDSLCHGASLNVPGVVKLESMRKGERVAVLTLKDELVGIGEAVLSGVQMMTEQRGVCVRMSAIFMLRGTYPRVC